MSKVKIQRTTALFPNGVFVQWDIESDESGVHYVDVLRAGAPEGPWEPVVSQLANAYNVLDDLQPVATPVVPREAPNQYSLARQIYYRVDVTPPSGTVFSSEPLPVEPHLDTRTKLLKRKIQRDQAVGYKRLNGIPIIVLKRRRWGERCPVCYDETTKQALVEHCTTCFGTSFVGGYWQPVLIRGRREAASVQTNVSSHGDNDVKIADFNILDYPLVEYQDVIIDLVRGDRYEVQRAHETELKSVPVHQKVTASLLNRGSVEYTVLVDPYATPPLY